MAQALYHIIQDSEHYRLSGTALYIGAYRKCWDEGLMLGLWNVGLACMADCRGSLNKQLGPRIVRIDTGNSQHRNIRLIGSGFWILNYLYFEWDGWMTVTDQGQIAFTILTALRSSIVSDRSLARIASPARPTDLREMLCTGHSTRVCSMVSSRPQGTRLTCTSGRLCIEPFQKTD